jgi:hypothetical protein
MAYYGQTSSPYDVQANQGGRFDFESVKKRYKETKPLTGKRKAENIRPLCRRDRAWERIFEVSENEYYVSFDAYKYRTTHNKAITWSLNGDMETMTIHTPKKVWGTPPTMELHPRTLSSSSVFWFYDFNLPNDFGMVNFRANKYIRYDSKYYSIELGDVVFQRKVGDNHWLPLVVHREFKHTLDRTQTKQLRETIKPFMAYYDIMCEIVETKWEWGNPIYKAVVGDNDKRMMYAEEALTLFKPRGDGVPDSWLSMVERYKHRITRRHYGSSETNLQLRNKLPKEICKDLFEIVKPCKTTEVPIGTLTHDRYKGWYR